MKKLLMKGCDVIAAPYVHILSEDIRSNFLRNMDVEVDARNNSRHAISSHAKRARKNKIKKLYADPYYWAAFILLDGVE